MTIRSNTQIRKLGDRIRLDIDNPPANLYDELEEFRVSYKRSIKNIFGILYKESKSIRNDAITTYRIKRIESIIGKLKRYPKMDLDRMWDIAGCRCILNTEVKVYKLLNILNSKLEIKKINDYYKDIQEDGYRSLHLYVLEKDGDKRPIELQLRTKGDHNWATLVEIIDLLYSKKIKEGQKDKDFEDFHKLMSKLNVLEEKEKVDLIEIIHKHQIFNRLYSVFIQNYLKVRVQWLNLEKSKKDHFYIIEVKSGNQPTITSYQYFNSSETDYFEKFKKNINSNIVLTYLPQANFQNLEMAYANYTLTTHTFIDDYFRLISDVCIKLIEEKEMRRFYKMYCSFLDSWKENQVNIQSELETINSVEVSNPKKVKYWKKDFIKRINKRLRQVDEMIDKINDVRPSRGIDSIKFLYYGWLIRRKKV